MRKIWLIGILFIGVLGAGKREVRAAEHIDATSEMEMVSTGTIQPRAVKIEYVYRTYKGRVQYRRWNITQGKWQDPTWITL